MKVELILPRKEEDKLINLGCYLVPQTLTQLAAVTPSDIDLKLTDENYEEINFDSDVDLVGISVMTSQFNRAMQISTEYKSKGVKVVWGGIHPTVMDQSENENIDSIVIGEAEMIWPKLLEDSRQGQLKRHYQNRDPVDLNKIPLPRRDLMYPQAEVLIESALASRGCNYRCEHCSASSAYGKRLRMVDIDRVIEDIHNMRSNIFAFFDDNIFSSRNYGIELLKEVAKVGKYLLVQIDPRSALNETLVEALGNAGVKLALVGFESVNPENFQGNPKYVPPGEWAKIAENMHRYDIKIDGSFMFGLDYDGPDVFCKTNEAVKKAGIDFLSPSIITPYPKTPLHDRLDSEGRILHHEWDKYDLSHVVFRPKLLASEEVMEGVRILKQEHGFIFSYVKEIFQE